MVVKKKVKKKVVKKAKAKSKPVKKAEPKAKKEKQIGTVTNYFDHVKAAAIKLSAPLKVGDSVHITGGEVDFEQAVKGMQVDREDVDKGKKGDEVGIIVKKKVRKGYKVFKK